MVVIIVRVAIKIQTTVKEELSMKIETSLNSALSEFNLMFDSVKELYLDRVKGFFDDLVVEDEKKAVVTNKLLQLTNFRIQKEIGKLKDQVELVECPVLLDRIRDLEYCLENSTLLYELRDKF